MAYVFRLSTSSSALSLTVILSVPISTLNQSYLRSLHFLYDIESFQVYKTHIVQHISKIHTFDRLERKLISSLTNNAKPTSSHFYPLLIMRSQSETRA